MTIGPGAAEPEREVERVADRLQVVGPRLPLATQESVRGVLQLLADLASDAEHQDRRPVPVLAPHGLGDQVLVLGHDLLAVADPDAREAGLAALVELRRAL